MKLVINGKQADINESLTVGRLLVRENVRMPEMVSVELNGKILKRTDFERTKMKDGDTIEFLYFMGGGHAIE